MTNLMPERVVDLDEVADGPVPAAAGARRRVGAHR